jgi:hypothetical protein
MIHHDALASISDDDLFVTVQRLTARSNVALADLLAHLGEVERRGIHRLRACASLYTYCIYELRLSEDAAYEIHHRRAHALGGPETLDNLELRCRSHSALAAEEDFGREHMEFARGVALDTQEYCLSGSASQHSVSA